MNPCGVRTRPSVGVILLLYNSGVLLSEEVLPKRHTMYSYKSSWTLWYVYMCLSVCPSVCLSVCLCCAVLCCAVLCFAVLRFAVLSALSVLSVLCNALVWVSVCLQVVDHLMARYTSMGVHCHHKVSVIHGNNEHL